jgi:hypothetical protein
MESNMNASNNSTDQKSERPKTIEERNGATTPKDDVCQKAPEWAEHSRLNDEDEPCDDGRWGNLERDKPGTD